MKNKSIIKSARYRFQNPRDGEKTREELEEISRHFSLLYVCGVIASRHARKLLDAKRRSNIHFYPDDWKNLLIPDAPESAQVPVIELVKRIHAAKAQNLNADTSNPEAEIDHLVYQLYNLTDDEIKLVAAK